MIRIFGSWRPKWGFCCQDSKSATLYVREHQVPGTCQHLKHGLSAKNPMTISWHRWLVSQLQEVRCSTCYSWTNWPGVWRLRAVLSETLRLYSLKCWDKWAKQIVELPGLTSREQISACLRICWAGSHGRQLAAPRTAGWSSRTVSSKQNWSTPSHTKMSKHVTRPVWMSRTLSTDLKYKREVCRK